MWILYDAPFPALSDSSVLMPSVDYSSILLLHLNLIKNLFAIPLKD